MECFDKKKANAEFWFEFKLELYNQRFFIILLMVNLFLACKTPNIQVVRMTAILMGGISIMGIGFVGVFKSSSRKSLDTAHEAIRILGKCTNENLKLKNKLKE